MRAALSRVAGWACLAVVAACRPPYPVEQPQRALVRDLSRVVEIKQGVGWIVDEWEIERAVPDALKSVCQVPREARTLALAWLDETIAERGGDVATVWRARGKKLGKVDELLFFTRIRLLLQRAEQWAAQGRCPFWVETTPAFPGVQTQGHRFLVTLEGGGRVTGELALGRVKYGGGGSGRLLGGYAFGEDWALTMGPEFGGDARFTNLELGQAREFPELVAFASWPVVLRWQFGLSAHAEIEAGPLAYFDQASTNEAGTRVNARYYGGIHSGVALGGTYLRLARGVLPKFSVAVTVDVIPAVNGHAALTQIGIGLRTGVDVSRWYDF